MPHKYTGPTGHYVIVQTPGDTLHRLIFETDGSRVVRFRAGRRPGVDYVEGVPNEPLRFAEASGTGGRPS